MILILVLAILVTGLLFWHTTQPPQLVIKEDMGVEYSDEPLPTSIMTFYPQLPLPTNRVDFDGEVGNWQYRRKAIVLADNSILHYVIEWSDVSQIVSDFPGGQKIIDFLEQQFDQYKGDANRQIESFSTEYRKTSCPDNYQYVYQTLVTYKLEDYFSTVIYKNSCLGEGHASGTTITGYTFDREGNLVTLPEVIDDHDSFVVALNQACQEYWQRYQFGHPVPQFTQLPKDVNFYLSEEGVVINFYNSITSFADGPAVVTVPYKI